MRADPALPGHRPQEGDAYRRSLPRLKAAMIPPVTLRTPHQVTTIRMDAPAIPAKIAMMTSVLTCVVIAETTGSKSEYCSAVTVLVVRIPPFRKFMDAGAGIEPAARPDDRRMLPLHYPTVVVKLY